MRMLHNPILPGFYPDPSVCKRGEDFYLVTSSFEYFPGVPIFHSRDFVHWRQIGHCLDRPSQLNLDGVRPSQGVYAPTIRYHDGLFYMVTTLVKDPPYHGNVNFYVTARDPAGPWSDPTVIKDAPGIDPTIFFDDDGKAYYLGNLRPRPEELISRHIWMQELDLATGTLLGERVILLKDGAVRGAKAPEAPHLYHIGDYYYLLIAEGGTAHDHAVSVFRSRQLFGPYEINPRNPVLTHRHLSRSSAINSTGHADLVEVLPGEWWAILLASRPDGGDWRNLGRETFAVPVVWEEAWPVFSPQTGRVEFAYPAPGLPEHRFGSPPACDHFDSPVLDLRWNFLRTPRKELYSLSQRPGWLRLHAQKESLRENACPAFLGRRQQHLCFSARTMMEFHPTGSASAGLVLLMNHDYHIRMELLLLDGQCHVVVVRRAAGVDEEAGRLPCRAGRVWLKVEAYEQSYQFYCATEPEQWRAVVEHVDGTILSKEAAGGFTGAYVGLYAAMNGSASSSYADFDWFEYIPLDTLS